jgi:predicted ArsR family transcriptional regulator
MENSRQVVLRRLKEYGPATIADLADFLGVAPMTVRHHLNGLLADGLITSQAVRRSVGRPALVYRLTEAGEELFPRKYLRLTDRLLDELKAAVPPEVIDAIFTHMAHDMATDIRERLSHVPIEGRMAALVELLGEEGFMARWERVEPGYRLTEYNCPYFHIGQRHPEVCRFDQSLISTVLDVPVEKDTCLLDGDSCCTFTIPATQIQLKPAKS